MQHATIQTRCFSENLVCSHLFLYSIWKYLSMYYLNFLSVFASVFRGGGYRPSLLRLSPSHSFLRPDKLCSDHKPRSTLRCPGTPTRESSGRWRQLICSFPRFNYSSAAPVKCRQERRETRDSTVCKTFVNMQAAFQFSSSSSPFMQFSFVNSRSKQFIAMCRNNPFVSIHLLIMIHMRPVFQT